MSKKDKHKDKKKKDKKKPKEKCCQKYKTKGKHCKDCPLLLEKLAQE
jgi:hypothetical protein